MPKIFLVAKTTRLVVGDDDDDADGEFDVNGDGDDKDNDINSEHVHSHHKGDESQFEQIGKFVSDSGLTSESNL